MTGLKPRRTLSHTIEGTLNDFNLAASSSYLGWPRDIVRRPLDQAMRKKAERVFEKYLRYRTPESWSPGDYVKLARLACDTVYHERESHGVCEGLGGDLKLMQQLQSNIAMLSRQLGLNTSPLDPRLHGAQAEARRRATEILHTGDNDGLLAMPGYGPRGTDETARN